ncbi:hypothetical protein [Cryptosporangium aurantiacum]|uniref:Uncharacterized protein n=1 Tax=Cryptosporangium aurantiacum TaxID=134849 RepID=A0A1M7PD76_9ACTN|nr:hypothetical protein [Cryptosporangium aurantiacum]SHN14917.1 hypothetical protein SAMN05443668_103232 [Cryptosporangium aurantiacum]
MVLALKDSSSWAIGAFVHPWRDAATLTLTVGVGLLIGALTYGASRPLRRARPALIATTTARRWMRTAIVLSSLLGPVASCGGRPAVSRFQFNASPATT